MAGEPDRPDGVPPPRARRWARFLPWTLGLVVAGFVLLCLVASLDTSTTVPPPSSEQLDYQADIKDGRSRLFPGTLHVKAARTVPVERETRIAIWACGPDSGAKCPYLARPASGTPTPDPSRPPVDIPLGARVRIDLNATDPDVLTIRPVDAGDPAQPLIARDDVASWEWFARADQPGTYTLIASVSVLAEETDTLLVPRERREIEVTVTRTAAYTAKQATRSGWAVAQWVIATGIALLGTGVLTAAGLARWRRGRPRRARRRRADPDQAG